MREERENAVHRLDHVRAGLAENCQQNRGLAVGHARIANVFDGINDVADRFEPHGRAVAPGDDQRAILMSLEKLVAGANAPRMAGVCHLALGPIRICRGERRAHGLHADAIVIQLRGIHLHAHGRASASPDEDLADTFHLRKLLREDGVRRVIHLGPRNIRGCQTEEKDGRVRRVHFAIGRLARQVGGKLAAGGVDGCLDIARGGVDIAAEIELQGDVG